MSQLYKTSHGDFEWDTEKADTNRRKHGVTFEQAAEAFADPHALVSYDVENSGTEGRFRLLGMSGASIILFVVFVEREIIRIISARKATRMEARRYGSNRQHY